MLNDVHVTSYRAGKASAALQRVLSQLPMGGLERRAIEAGEIDAIIDYGHANVIVFPEARRALRDIANRVSADQRKATLVFPARNSFITEDHGSEFCFS